MATFLQVLQRLAQRLQLDETKSAEKTRLQRFVLEGIDLIEEEMDWPFLIHTDATGTAVTSSTTSISLASTFFKVVKAYCRDNSVTPATQWDLELLQEPVQGRSWNSRFGTDPTSTNMRGTPMEYTIRWSIASGVSTASLVPIPLPDAAFTIFVNYLSKLPALSADADENYFTTNYSNLVIDAATVKGSIGQNDKEKLLLAKREYSETLSRVMAKQAQATRPFRYVHDPRVFRRASRSP